MSTLKLKISNENSQTLAESPIDDFVSIHYKSAYEKGDFIILETTKTPCFCVVQFDDSLPKQLIYITKNIIKYIIPFDSDKVVFSPKAFSGESHVITARFAREDEITARQNLALNVYDRHGENGYFPHSSANVETRGEAVFASYNAIDGVFKNIDHGKWPYQSWGINKDPNAAITIDFGKEVAVDEVGITLRADFPHDSYWLSGTISFSDGSFEELHFEKTGKPQYFKIQKRTVTWARFEKLIKADDESPFPALTQVEIFGVHV